MRVLFTWPHPDVLSASGVEAIGVCLCVREGHGANGRLASYGGRYSCAGSQRMPRLKVGRLGDSHVLLDGMPSWFPRNHGDESCVAVWR